MSSKRPLDRASLTLTTVDQRLLLWLARYPLQRAEDLVLGLARWCTRPTVYRHLAGLEAAGWITALRPASSGGARLFLLSPAGFRGFSGLEALSGEKQEEPQRALLHLLPGFRYGFHYKISSTAA